MAVRVAKFREQPWGSELSQRAMPNDEPLKDKNVLAVLEQLTALADTASNYFSASCRRVSCGASVHGVQHVQQLTHQYGCRLRRTCGSRGRCRQL
jgi:uncharacterized protein YciW